MNYNLVFAPTAAFTRFINRAHTLDVAFTERHVTPHLLNARTYALIGVVLALTAISTALTFIAAHINRIPEYRIRLQLAKVRTHRSINRQRIAFYSFISYHGLDTKAAQLRSVWQRKGAIARTALDAVFCLN